MLSPEFREVDEPSVTVDLGLGQAESVQGAISDVLCWIRGWMAGATEQALNNAPIGVETLREFNIIIKRAIENVEATQRNFSK